MLQFIKRFLKRKFHQGDYCGLTKEQYYVRLKYLRAQAKYLKAEAEYKKRWKR
jgi:hypothetical protein